MFTTNVPFLSGQISLKNFRSSSGRWLSIGTQYLLNSIISSRNREHLRRQTILHVTYLPVSFLETFVEQISARSPVPHRSQPRIHKNREKRIRHDWKSGIHARWCARHA